MAALLGTMYFANKSATSSERYGTGLRSCFGVSGAAGTFHPYPPLFPFPFDWVFRSDVCIIPTLTGGSGRKYNAYALARKLAISTRLGTMVEKLMRSGRWSRAGTRGRSESAIV